MEILVTNLTLKLAPGSTVDPYSMTLQVKAILKIFPTQLAVICQPTIAVEVQMVSLEVMRAEEWFRAKSADVRSFGSDNL